LAAEVRDFLNSIRQAQWRIKIELFGFAIPVTGVFFDSN